jgi:hypothetical protein
MARARTIAPRVGAIEHSAHRPSVGSRREAARAALARDSRESLRAGPAAFPR